MSSNYRGLSGSNYDRWVESQHGASNTTLGRMQQGYWVAKQTVYQKLGKKEDESVAASDAELDSKLDLFKSVQVTSFDLQKIIGKYQAKLCNLSQEENSLGRFLKECGKQDKTRAGKMMTSVGKTMSYSAQQRLALRVPLLRLHQEVETFRKRAVLDTAETVGVMEKARTEYRGALLWMKNVSQELDPDTYKQLERFRKVQGMVRTSKMRFDRHKLDCMQKVDLLAASRCNMFSHALILYQNNLIQFWEKNSNTMNAIAESFKGFQHYEFNVIKELVEPSRKLAEETNPIGDDDRLLFFEEYHDEDDEKESSQQAKPNSKEAEDVDLLVSLDDNTGETENVILNEILDKKSSNWGPEWEAVFGGCDEAKDSPTHLSLFGGLPSEASATQPDPFLPSQLLELNQGIESLQLTKDLPEGEASDHSLKEVKPSGKKPQTTKKEGDLSSWYNLFAELDPLTNPDTIGGRPELLG